MFAVDVWVTHHDGTTKCIAASDEKLFAVGAWLLVIGTWWPGKGRLLSGMPANIILGFMLL